MGCRGVECCGGCFLLLKWEERWTCCFSFCEDEDDLTFCEVQMLTWQG